MATDFQRVRFVFPSHTGSAQSRDITAVFPTNVRHAEVALSGFNIGFSSSNGNLAEAQPALT
jgi:hypothetical protein